MKLHLITERAEASRRSAIIVAVISTFVIAVFLQPAGAAAAATPSAGWRIQVIPETTYFTAAQNAICEEVVAEYGEHIGPATAPEVPELKCERYLITARNEGAIATDGSTITISDALPAGLTAVSMANGRGSRGRASTPVVDCDLASVSCTYEGSIASGGGIVVSLMVEVSPGLADGASLVNQATVSGGGAPPASVTVDNRVGPGPPPFSLTGSSLYVNDPSGADARQAGSHPISVVSSFVIPDERDPLSSVPFFYKGAHPPKDLVAELPLGLVGDPQALPRCPEYLLAHEQCPADTQVGELGIEFTGSGSPGIPSPENYQIYNVVPEHGYAAEFGFTEFEKEIFLYAELVHGPSGYTLKVSAPGLPRLYPFLEIGNAVFTIYGNPSISNGGSSVTPFLTNPSDCSGAARFSRLWGVPWDEPSKVVTADVPTYPEGISGCNLLRFDPAIESRAVAITADSPSSLSFDLKVPQDEDPEGLATPPVRDITVALPKGLAVSSSSAAGLAGCPAEGPEGINVGSSDSTVQGQDLGDPLATELGEGHAGGNGSPYDDGLWHTAPGRCPDASRIGSVEVTTPLLDHPLPGKVFLGAPECAPCSDSDAASGRLLKLYLEIDDPQSGVIVKLPGSVKADPTSGQLTAVFEDAPQLPFSDFKLHLKEGPAAPLRTPTTCGTYTTATDLVPWSAPETPSAAPGDSFAVTSVPGASGCPTTEAALPDAQGFEAGTVTAKAGAYSPFVLKVSRADGSQQISQIDATLPEGLLGRLRGIPYCPDAALAAAAGHGGRAEQASPSCPAASQVGTVNVGAGPGPSPYHVQGRAYLAGPYKGAPLSLAIVVPAVAGPFDLGDVVVRTALNVNPVTAQIHAVSDPIPQILAGIPLDLRSVAVDLDRSQFTLNPTSCEPMPLLGAATTTTGAVSSLYQRFQVGGCDKLAFKPKLELRLKGGTKRSKKPALTATVTYPKQGNYANIARAAVGLPHSEFLDQAHIKTICTRVQFAAEDCPKGAIYGHAEAWSPLLDEPLKGPVYLRSSSHKLPDLVADLRGQIEIALDGRIDTDPQGGIRTTFEGVPDAPVSKFVLRMAGGKKGLLENSEDLCHKPQRAVARFTAHNARLETFKAKIANSCKSKGKRGRKHHGR
jgi:hypothetical protein